MALTGHQLERLAGALISAYPRRAALKRMLLFKVDQRVDVIVSEQLSLEETILAVVEKAEAEGWIDRLVRGAIEGNRGNQDLRRFFENTWIALDVPRPALESLIRAENPMADLEPWVDGLLQNAHRVCRVEIDTNAGPVFGTAFLVGPAAIITNYHVFEPVIRGEQGQATDRGIRASAGNARFRFDYRRLPDGSVTEGKTYGVHGASASDWLLDASPVSGADLTDDSAELPGSDELDYALIRLSAPPSEDSVNRLGTSPAPRGWISAPRTPPVLAEGTPVAILQHPDGSHLKLALESQGLARLNENRTRVRYRVNTLGGSSGSPCFNHRWELIALHHRGDPAYPHLPAGFNQGIPFAAVQSLLRQRGADKHLGAPA